MNLRIVAWLLVFTTVLVDGSLAEDKSFVPLFSGKDLSGWVPVNVAPTTFTVRDNMIVSTGIPTGIMRTERQYENFILELEWRHMKPKGNAGVFVWSSPLTAPGTPFAKSIEVQILDGHETANYTSHGDLFSIHGATMTPDRPHPAGWPRCLPSEKRAKPSPEWNHYRIECLNGTIKLAVNGKVVSGGHDCSPRKGYICLESEGSECHFRNLRIKELPSSSPKPEETAPLAEDYRSLYNGLDLANWLDDPGHRGHWQARDWVLDYDGQSRAGSRGPRADRGHLWTEQEFQDFDLICDWRLTAKPQKRRQPVIQPNGDDGPGVASFEDAGNSGVFLRGEQKAQVNIWCHGIGSGEIRGYRTDRAQPAEVRAGCTPSQKSDRPIGQWNRFLISMRGERVTVILNGETVINDVQLPGVPARGRIGLQHRGHPIQFANLLIREVK